jgi:hypothetical protein
VTKPRPQIIGAIFVTKSRMTIDGINPKKSNLYRSDNKKPADLDNERTILLYLGLAISSWQYVEEALSQVCIHVRAENMCRPLSRSRRLVVRVTHSPGSPVRQISPLSDVWTS